MKRCPNCKRAVPVDARRCVHCRAFVNDTPVDNTMNAQNKYDILSVSQFSVPVMNDHRKKSNLNSYADYQGYDQNMSSNSAQSKTEITRATRELEREILIQEYKNDRDVIIQTIKDALKNRRYTEAQEFVYKYRAAAKSDEEFSVLAKMTAQGLEKFQEISNLVTALDATPEDDYPVRLELCQRILQKQPDNIEYQKELERYRIALGIKPKPESTALVVNGKTVPSQAQSTTGKIAKVIFALAFMFNAICLVAALTVEETLFFENHAFFPLILLTVFQGILLWPRKKKPAYSVFSLISRIAISWFLWLFVFIFIFIAI